MDCDHDAVLADGDDLADVAALFLGGKMVGNASGEEQCEQRDPDSHQAFPLSASGK